MHTTIGVTTEVLALMVSICANVELTAATAASENPVHAMSAGLCHLWIRKRVLVRLLLLVCAAITPASGHFGIDYNLCQRGTDCNDCCIRYSASRPECV